MSAVITNIYDLEFVWRGGHYVVQRVEAGAYVDVRPLDRDEAITYRTASGEVLRLEWPQ